MRNDMRFAHAAARVAVLETRLLDRGRLERLVEAADTGEVLRLLAETDYGPALAALPDGADYEQALAAELERVYALVEGFSPEPRLLASWASRNAFLNLKALLKAALGGEAAGPGALAPGSPVPTDALAALVAEAVAVGEGAGVADGARRAPGVPGVRLPQVISAPPKVRVGGRAGEPVSGPELWPALGRAAEEAAEAYRAQGQPEEIDFAVDLAYQDYLLRLAALPGAEFLRGWVERWTDLTNLRTFVRFANVQRSVEALRRALLPGGALSVGRLAEVYAREETAKSRLEALRRLADGTRYRDVVAEGLERFAAEGLLTGFERASDLFLLAYLKQARRHPFGMAPVWAYLMAKEQEVRLLRLILVGKSAGLSPERLRERLSDVYA